jgi:hypothetical protein
MCNEGFHFPYLKRSNFFLHQSKNSFKKTFLGILQIDVVTSSTWLDIRLVKSGIRPDTEY